ncbi:pentapeptide repeat-containing protein [Fibrisoma limi]|nr:pentapeptide repeat-containing protein [Fibrisoma limi]
MEDTFLRNANFRNATFLQGAIFPNATFLQDASFDIATFSQNADFSQATFSQHANFSQATFSQHANFSGATFLQNADFRYAKFSRNASFYGTTFLRNADFSGTTLFSQNVYFDDAQLPDTLRFESVNMGNEVSAIYLSVASVDSLRKRTAESTRKCVIFLWHTDVSKLVLNHDKFALGYDEDVNWEDRISTYQQTIKSCRDRGLEASAQGFDIDMQKMKLEYSWGFLAPAIIWFQEYWWNFGYDRSRILQNTFYAFVASFLLFLLGFQRFMNAYFPSDQLGLTASKARVLCYYRSPREHWPNRFKIVLFYTALVFFSWKMDHSKVNYRQYPWTSLAVYLVFTIGLIHLAYLAAFVIAR